MKKFMATASIVLALTMSLSAPASAIAIVTGDSFGKSSKAKWVTDRYEPEEFDNSGKELYLAVGKTGYYKYRPTDKKDKTYALQGKKLETGKPSSNTWTATVKLNVDDTWFSSSSNKKRAEFRVDLVDGDGNEISDSPAIALIKGGSGAPVFKFYNPKAKSSWGMGNKFINGDKEMEDLFVEEGWHTLLIKSTKGVLTYYIDEKKIGNCTINERDVYPSYMALNAYNYDRPDVISWDNCYLYDGSYVIRQLSSSAAEKRDDRLASQYEKKRANWEKKYKVYRSKDNANRWFTASEWKKEYNVDSIPSDVATSTSKEMPESYWDY
ncbi:hypothetical protein V6615_14495 [Oscillospiraceae bacterium PP1C4]